MEKLTLITGDFSHEEAREILMNVFSTKINFHQRKNFSALERFGTEDATALQRIPALRAEVERLEKILANAKNSGKQLKIRSELIIDYMNVVPAMNSLELAGDAPIIADQAAGK